MILTLNFAEQLDPATRMELEQLIAALQTGFNTLSVGRVSGAWVNPVCVPSMFTLAGGGNSWTPNLTTSPAGSRYPLSYLMLSPSTMLLSVDIFNSNIVVGTTGIDLRIQIPDGFRLVGSTSGDGHLSRRSHGFCAPKFGGVEYGGRLFTQPELDTFGVFVRIAPPAVWATSAVLNIVGQIAFEVIPKTTAA